LQYEAKLFKLLDDYDKAFMFNADNVGSKQFMDIRAVCSIDVHLQGSSLCSCVHGLACMGLPSACKRSSPALLAGLLSRTSECVLCATRRPLLTWCDLP
jgi:hypothetical protein